MISRREFVAAGAAAAVLPGSAAEAQRTYVVPPQHMPKIVRIREDLPPGEIHVDPSRFLLFWTLEDRRAIHYMVGVGKDGLYQSGEFTVGRKAEWPSWTPTPQMIERNPEQYAQFADGVPGGPTNPLGARALYLHNARGYDTALRIHGTPKPWTVGRAVSNGCARLVNSHMVHLYDRVPVGTRVVLYAKARQAA